jgi:DNA-binding transcriptional ArsR family regulator
VAHPAVARAEHVRELSDRDPQSWSTDYTTVIQAPAESSDMSDTAGIEGTSLTHRIVLLGVVDLGDRGTTPAHAGEIRRACKDSLDAVESEVVGTLSGAEVSRALNELEAAGLLSAIRGDRSATGKGRPRFELAVERDALLADLDEDERVGLLVGRVAA